jgi:NADPH-dependent 2,4-dienoyl-CoA reductase/sulfur reductase-like enzyme
MLSPANSYLRGRGKDGLGRGVVHLAETVGGQPVILINNGLCDLTTENGNVTLDTSCGNGLHNAEGVTNGCDQPERFSR